MYPIGINNSVYAFAFKGRRRQAACPKDFIGTIEKTNKKGETLILEYEDGRIKSSTRKGEKRPYKLYSYNDFPELILGVLEFDRHKFADGSQLDSDQFYSTGKSERRLIETRLDDLTIRNNYILINKNAKYKGEPMVKSQASTLRLDTLCCPKMPVKTTLKPCGQEKFEFKTLDEAKEYFAFEYGIDADFMNLKQAFITKEAVDDFVKLNYQGLGKRIFEGLKITCAPLDGDSTSTIAKAYCNVEIKTPDDIPAPDLDNSDCSEEEFENKALDFLETLDDDNVKLNCTTIVLNSNRNWDSFEQDLKKSFETNVHPTSECKYGIGHEFIHYLHSRNIPVRQYLIMRRFDDDSQAEIAKEMGSYAITNPADFVAEYGTARMAGKKCSKAADELYKKLGGPDLWNEACAC